ncbi:MAG TPA: hypothetical protein VF157_08590 [Chloroflexota bacterium]
MTWLRATWDFVYDFLADDGWETLVGLVILLPLTYFISGQSSAASGLVLVIGVLLTLAVSLARKLPKPAR